jgi:DNA-binding transcriptional ArsR family regulator
MTTKNYSKIAEIFKVLSNPKRLEILSATKDREVTVNELSKILKVRKSNTSQHLAILRYLGLVSTRREGKNMFYKSKNPKIAKLIGFLEK